MSTDRSFRNLIGFLVGILLILLIALLALPAHAQTVDTTATSGSQSGASTNTRVENALNINNETVDTLRNAPGHGLAAATNSFSSDYCGGTVQVGGSGLGWSIGGSKQAYDKNCQALRRADKFGQQSQQAKNFGQHDTAAKLLAMSIYEVCRLDAVTVEYCKTIGLVKPQD